MTEEQKQRNRDRARAWALANPERAKAKSRECYLRKARAAGVQPRPTRTPEEKKQMNLECQKRYRANPENCQKVRERNRAYQKTPEGRRQATISNWKRLGIICDYAVWYERYISTTECENCGVELGEHGDRTGTFRTLDHDHDTGIPRNILCHRCNILRG
jgi:hypothetical protein